MKVIEFETAKLVKKKGFDELCLRYYTNDGKLEESYEENDSSTDVEFRVDLDDLFENYNYRFGNTCSAPTQSELQTWLRDIHQVRVFIIAGGPGYFRYCYYIETFNHSRKLWEEIEDKNKYFDSYEEALEKGLVDALNYV